MTENQALQVIANEITGLTSNNNANAEHLNIRLESLGDQIDKVVGESTTYLDDIRSAISKNTEALHLIAQILRNK